MAPSMPGRNKLIYLLDAPAPPVDKNLFGLSREQLRALIVDLGQPVYRVDQLLTAMFRQSVDSLDAVSVLPRALREEIVNLGWGIAIPKILEGFRSVDGTERYLIAGEDGQTVETVWMPGGDGGEKGDDTADDFDGANTKRATICVSSQVGCAVNCRFCLTAKLGLQRNLKAGEIAGQVIAVLGRHKVELGRDRINLVFMGMGEPFLNYDEFMAAVRLLVEETGIAESRMTVSTSGIVPGILRFAQESVRPKLAISLNASNDRVREEIMPVTRKWKIEDVMHAAAQLKLRPRERVTFEYVLLGGINDSLQQADELVRLVRSASFPSKVNLIAWNSGPGIEYVAPESSRVEAFQKRLIQNGVPAFLRRPRGRDIYAACGQLKRTTREI
ncbi:MAG TPA: 23S rRNA (adenine(2503)-C(2))-methyltransferase RlmN [Acidobacteriaceae bacterium]